MNNHNIKSTVIQDFKGLTIIIPSSISLTSFFALLLIIAFFFYMEFPLIIHKYIERVDLNDWFELSFLFMWIWCCLSLIKAILMGLFGKEILRVSSTDLKLKNSILGFGRTKNIPIYKISKITTNLDPDKVQLGKIVIHYDSKTIYLGKTIRSDEALYLIQLINSPLSKAVVK